MKTTQIDKNGDLYVLYRGGRRVCEDLSFETLAAAPEMLEALRFIKDAQTAKLTENACVLTLEAAQMIDAAISKAEGKE